MNIIVHTPKDKTEKEALMKRSRRRARRIYFKIY